MRKFAGATHESLACRNLPHLAQLCGTMHNRAMSTQRKYAGEHGPLPVWGFSDKIRKARDMTGLGQKEFAERIALTSSTLAAYETGRSAPRFNDAPALAKRLQLITGVPADWFLVVDDPNTPTPVGPAGIEPTTSTV